MVQVIVSPVNQGLPRIRTIVPNAILLNHQPPQVKSVPSVASATVPLAPRAPHHARHALEGHQTIASSVLPVSLLLTANVYRLTQMASVRGRVLLPTTISANVMVSHSQKSIANSRLMFSIKPVALNAQPARYPISM